MFGNSEITRIMFGKSEVMKLLNIGCWDGVTGRRWTLNRPFTLRTAISLWFIGLVADTLVKALMPAHAAAFHVVRLFPWLVTAVVMVLLLERGFGRVATGDDSLTLRQGDLRYSVAWENVDLCTRMGRTSFYWLVDAGGGGAMFSLRSLRSRERSALIGEIVRRAKLEPISAPPPFMSETYAAPHSEFSKALANWAPQRSKSRSPFLRWRKK